MDSSWLNVRLIVFPRLSLESPEGAARGIGQEDTGMEEDEDETEEVGLETEGEICT